MKKIEITEENKEMYKKFVNIKNGDDMTDCITILITLGVLPYMPCLCGIVDLLKIASIYSLQGTAIISGGVVAYLFCAYHLLGHFMKKGNSYSRIKMKKFKKEYPDFDTNIDAIELEKELEKYEALSSAKDIENKKEEHLSKFADEFKSMSAKEKIAFLEKEKEFWQQAQQSEEMAIKYMNEEQEEYQKTIGSIK